MCLGLENEPDLVKDAVPLTKPALRISALSWGGGEGLLVSL